MSVLTATAFESLLNCLDAGDQNRAAEKYATLRLKIVKCLTWRKNCPESEADSLADTVLDRVAAKIIQGEQIKNMNAYACTILEYVWKEHFRRHKEEAVGDEKIPEKTVEFNDDDIFQEPDLRLRCLRKCMAEKIPDMKDRRLITGYYDIEAGDKLKDVRKALADELGLTMLNLKVKACRLRDRLEECINGCVARLSVTKTAFPNTNNQGGDVK